MKGYVNSKVNSAGCGHRLGDDAKERGSLVGISPAGDRAMLLETSSLDQASRLFDVLHVAHAEGRFDLPGFGHIEFVAAARSVLVRGLPSRNWRQFLSMLKKLQGEAGALQHDSRVATKTRIDMVYDGEDLAEVASLLGISRERVVSLHQSVTYRVAFSGFAPGFVYLSGGVHELVVPRRQVPRIRVRPGSLAIADEFSGIYPSATPAGWQIIGHTEHVMWDVTRASPAALLPGDLVDFVSVRERASLAVRPAVTAASEQLTPLPDPIGEAVLEVIEPGLRTLVEDGGRVGKAQLGVNVSGVTDRAAYHVANDMVGNPSDSPVLELRMGEFRAKALQTVMVALTGAPRSIQVVNGSKTRTERHYRPFRMDAQEVLVISGTHAGAASMLAVRGGVAATQVLGSASHDTLSGVGPAPIQRGDVIRRALDRKLSSVSPGIITPPQYPASGDLVTIRVARGPRESWFSASAVEQFYSSEWQVTPDSDRVGARLHGDPLTRAEAFQDRELPTEGIVRGAIQVPTAGQPVIFLADSPLTGGYPAIAVVIEEDLDLVGQLPPGARVLFTPIDLTNMLTEEVSDEN